MEENKEEKVEEDKKLGRGGGGREENEKMSRGTSGTRGGIKKGGKAGRGRIWESVSIGRE